MNCKTKMMSVIKVLIGSSKIYVCFARSGKWMNDLEAKPFR